MHQLKSLHILWCCEFCLEFKFHAGKTQSLPSTKKHGYSTNTHLEIIYVCINHYIYVQKKLYTHTLHMYTHTLSNGWKRK